MDETLGALHYEVTNLPSDHYFAAAGVWACGGDIPTALQFYGEPPTELILDLSQGIREISGVDFTFSEGELVCP